MSKVTLAGEYKRLILTRVDTHSRQSISGGWSDSNNKKPITTKLLRKHENREITIGAYSVGLDGKVKYIAFDIDNHPGDEYDEYIDYKEVGAKICNKLYEKYNLTPIIELSGSPNSIHIWSFLKPTKASKVIAFGKHILSELGLEDVVKEVFPKNHEDDISIDNPGNFIKLPECRHRKYSNKESKFLFPPDLSKPLEGELKPSMTPELRLHEIKPAKLPKIKKKKESKTTTPTTPTLSQIDINHAKDLEREKQHIAKNKLINDSIPSTSYISDFIDNVNKTCIKIIYYKQMQLNGPDGHNMRLAIIRDLIEHGWGKNLIHDFFKLQDDYNYQRIEKEIAARKTKIKDDKKKKQIELSDPTYNKKQFSRCKTMKKNCSPLIDPLCDACQTRKDFSSYINKGGSIRNLEIKSFVYDFRIQWKHIQKHGVSSSKFINISKDDIIKHTDIKEEEFNLFIMSLKMYNLIELDKKNKETHRIEYKGKRTRQVIKFKIKESEVFINV